jgi:predicted ATPase
MLTEFSLSNFKSYKDSRLPLGSLTVLIGANASGKSNIIEGLRFLSWLAEGQKLSSIQYAVNSADSDQVIRGRINDLCHYGESNFSFSCHLDSNPSNQLNITINVRDGEMEFNNEEIVASDGSRFSETGSLSPSQKLKYSHIFDDHRPKYPDEESPDRIEQLLIKSRATFTQLKIQPNQTIESQRIPEIAQEYQRVLQNIIFFDLVPAKMRDYSQKSDYKELIENGRNLSSVLFHLWENKPENQQIILNFIQSLPEQAIDGLDFLIGPRDEVMVRLSETFGNTQRYCEAALLSDGTLRVLAIAAAMLSAAEGSLVVIEEIDNGVHPSRAKHLLANIRDIAEKRKLRVLLSTHNPALMDALPDEALGDVVFCYRDPEQGDSRLIRLGDMDEFPRLVFQGPLGKLVTSGVVDRFVKHPQTPADRKQKAMEWLSHLQEYRNE